MNKQGTTLKAGKKEYDTFFSLYATAVRIHEWTTLLAAMTEEKNGYYFLPLGFIPGPAVLLRWNAGKVAISDATPDISRELEVPTGLMTVEELPEKIRLSLEERRKLVEYLGYEPSPWNGEFATQVLECTPRQYWAGVLTQFKYQGTVGPFGVVLAPSGEGDGMTVLRIYNPGNIPDTPAEGEILSFEDLSNEGPVQKLLRTCALMESNFGSRFHHNGQPLRQ